MRDRRENLSAKTEGLTQEQVMRWLEGKKYFRTIAVLQNEALQSQSDYMKSLMGNPNAGLLLKR